MPTFDYIIVGAGSAGCVLANRLTEDPDRTVLVLEAGGADGSPFIHMPIGYGLTYYNGRVNWKYMTEEVPELGRASYWPRGKVLGGSSSINAMVYVRGQPSDFDDWRDAGAAGWGWSDVEPYFRKMEAWAGPPDQSRGTYGPLPVEPIDEKAHPLSHKFVEAAGQAGLPLTKDYNGADFEGAGLYQLTTKDGFRASTARAYLRPARKRRTLKLDTNATVEEIMFDKNRATGIRYRKGGAVIEATARAAVILSAGAVNTPQLLQLSGVGSGELLQSLGIETRLNAPAVGAHLQDHFGVDFHYRCTVRTLNQVLRPWLGRALVGLQYVLSRKGPLSLSINQGGGFVRTDEGQGSPNMQLYFSPVSYTRAPPGQRPMMSPDPFRAFLMGYSACRPESRGWINIRSANPHEPPSIQPNYLSAEKDYEELRAGACLIRRIAAAPALNDVIEQEFSPGPDVTSDEALDEFTRNAGWTVFHPCCTARMGDDPATSVLDARLRVRGIDGLRVVDASAFPNITSGNINAPVIMLAEKAADIIKEDAEAGM